MKKTTSSKLTKQLAKYGAITTAIAGVADVNGQIIYTDISPDFNGNSHGDEFFLDLDGDMVNDFNINQTSYNLQINPLAAGNSVLGNGVNNYVYPLAMNSGAVISSGQANWNAQGLNTGYQYLNYGSFYTEESYSCSNIAEWCSENDKFLGLRFNIGGNTHYGWARLDTQFALSWTVKDFAYNATPNESIIAGQSLSVETNVFNTLKIIALNKSIALYNLTETIDYTLFDISGKKVLDGNIDIDTYTIDASGVSNGIYILEINSTESKSTLRKKVIL